MCISAPLCRVRSEFCPRHTLCGVAAFKLLNCDYLMDVIRGGTKGVWCCRPSYETMLILYCKIAILKAPVTTKLFFSMSW